ncbi:sorting nexin-29-like [Saccoglossus kowalevskii]|uniref:Sorting nexin-29-like n=1 Tax=Saccoglossus kowalevskii TaxID=10224 RepID=A0ABM0MEK2_SACKO|nr:PREDICTED: sorting nexin-29-like [Saccoglossus kowalevskii]
MSDDIFSNERQHLLDRLLDAVKQCQVRFGGRTELATDSDSRVSCLCAQFETVFQHGMKKINKPFSVFKQVTGITLPDIPAIKPENEQDFWLLIKEHLNKHELERYMTLKEINTDTGRGRAWLRSALNEHSLERYIHMILADRTIIKQYYEDWSFLWDDERSSMLPMMAAGLGSILFAINIDNEELNGGRQSSSAHGSPSHQSRYASRVMDEPQPVYPGDVLINEASKEKKREKKKKKKKGSISIVSFDGSTSRSYGNSYSVSLGSDTGSVDDKTRNIDEGISTVIAATHSTTQGFDVTNTQTTQLPFARTNSDCAIREMSTSYQTKTPPPTPCDPSILSQVSSSENLSKMVYVSERLAAQLESDVNSRNNHVTTSHITTSLSSELAKAHIGNQEGDDASSGQSGDLSGEVSRTGSSAVLHTIDDDNNADLYPISQDLDDTQSNDSSMLQFGTETENAAMGLALAVKSLAASEVQRETRTQGDGSVSYLSNLPSPKYETMSTGELKQAIVAMMVRKDEVEEQNKSLRSLLDSEMEHSAALRLQMEELKQEQTVSTDKLNNKLQALIRENELLKHQLKKYVGAVQMLRREGSTAIEGLPGIRHEEPQPVIPEKRSPVIDYSEEAQQYELKLIQVAEMHGELMEFNDRLHRQLIAKELLVQKMKGELVDLRGPLPEDELNMENTNTADPDSGSLSPDSRALVNLWIPSAFLKGKGKDSYHVYQIYVRIKDEEWNIYRRYSQFYDLHQKMRKMNPMLNTFDFPPKKTLGHKDVKFVEDRRKRLQHYLRCVLNLWLQNNPQLSSAPCKETLVTLIPFFREQPIKQEIKKPSKKFRRLSKNSAALPPPTQGQETQQTQYTGL